MRHPPVDEELDKLVQEHRKRLGRELSAEIFGSLAERGLILAPHVWHSEPDLVLTQEPPPGVTETRLMYQAIGVRLPLDTPTAVLGREMLLALLAMRIEPFDPHAL